MPVEFTASAGKHGFELADAVNAMLNHVDKVESFDEPRAPGRTRPDLYIGPARNRILIEVMVVRNPPSGLTVFHCMRARRKILDLVDDLRRT